MASTPCISTPALVVTAWADVASQELKRAYDFGTLPERLTEDNNVTWSRSSSRIRLKRNQKAPFPGLSLERTTGFEPATLSLGS